MSLGLDNTKYLFLFIFKIILIMDLMKTHGWHIVNAKGKCVVMNH